MEILSEEASAILGKPINLASPQQIAKALYDDLKLPERAANSCGMAKRREAKGHCTTNEVTLLELSKIHSLPKVILEFRQILKVKSTWVQGLIKKAILGEDGYPRIHSSWNATNTGTGRLSSSDPNLQNLPRSLVSWLTDSTKAEGGVSIRRAFVPSAGHSFVSADYSQIELRLAAHLSRDECLIRILRSHSDEPSSSDVFQSLAAFFFAKLTPLVTCEERQLIKRICYGVLYGQGRKAMANVLHSSAEEADRLLQRFFSLFPKMNEFVIRAREDARSHGFVKTMWGRTRPLPHINSANNDRRTQSERQAVNTLIQGSAADIIKFAMMATSQLEMEADERHIWLLLEIHDELVFEVPDEMLTSFVKEVAQKMQNVARLSVPLVVNVKTGKSWGDLE